MTPRRVDERGSVLMLMPAAVLIVLLLGAIAVDAAIVFLGQREAYNVAFDAANDAAGAGLDAGQVRGEGELLHDEARIVDLAEQAVDAAGVAEIDFVDAVVDESTGEVAVTVSFRVDRLFSPAFGRGDDESSLVTARVMGETGGP